MPKFSFHKLKLLIIILFTILSLIISPATNFFTSILGDTYLPHELHSQLTGAAALTDTTPYDVYGTDLGIILKHNGQYHYIFGETFSIGTTNWRSNTIAYSTDADPSDGISLNGWILDPIAVKAKELISSLKLDYVEMTCIPTAALSYNDIIYIYYMSVSHWGLIGGVWQCNNASIAISTDNGQNFSKMTNVSWSGTSNFVQFGFVQNQASVLSDGYSYFLATPSGRYGACYLCRVPQESLLNQTAYEYFTGTGFVGFPHWSSDHTEAEEIFTASVGELSVMWNEYLQKWTVFYFDSTNLKIVLRTADNLWGPWSSTYAIVGASEYPSLYGSYVHPDFVENSGEEVYFIMSQYNVYNTFVLSVDLSSLISTSSLGLPVFTFLTIFILVPCLSMIIRKLRSAF